MFLNGKERTDSEMLEDIKKLSILLSAFTKKDTVGEDYLEEVKIKYELK